MTELEHLPQIGYKFISFALISSWQVLCVCVYMPQDAAHIAMHVKIKETVVVLY